MENFLEQLKSLTKFTAADSLSCYYVEFPNRTQVHFIYIKVIKEPRNSVQEIVRRVPQNVTHRLNLHLRFRLSMPVRVGPVSQEIRNPGNMASPSKIP